MVIHHTDVDIVLPSTSMGPFVTFTFLTCSTKSSGIYKFYSTQRNYSKGSISWAADCTVALIKFKGCSGWEPVFQLVCCPFSC